MSDAISAWSRLKVLPQYFVPHHALSRLVGLLAHSTWPSIKNPLTRWFIEHFQVDLSEALIDDPTGFNSFNDFFTRELKPDSRPIANHSLVSPADGVISQLGPIQGQQIFQAKGHQYSLSDLLAGDKELSAEFDNGQFATIYLSPRDYHRVHMPLSGTLTKTIYVPGRLFSVNPNTAAQVPNLFARNERVICVFETELGPMAVILVGAMIVASIETQWTGTITPPERTLKVFDHGSPQQPLRLDTGAELGRFKLGSTVIMLLPAAGKSWLKQWQPGHSIKMGEKLIALDG